MLNGVIECLDCWITGIDPNIAGLSLCLQINYLLKGLNTQMKVYFELSLHFTGFTFSLQQNQRIFNEF